MKALFPPEQLLFVKSEDFFADQLRVTDVVCRFLGVAPLSDFARPAPIHDNVGVVPPIGLDDWNAAYDHLSADIDAVEQELGWDCSDWRQPPAATAASTRQRSTERLNEDAMSDPTAPRPTDNAFLGDLKGGSHEPTYGGALSFMRRRYSRALAGIDAVVWGIPFDTATSNRPGCRFGPQAIRRASAIFDGDPQYPFGFDPFETLAVVDYGDCAFDYGRPAEIPAAIEAQAADILASGAQLVTLGGDHFVTYPLLKAHAARHGPLALDPVRRPPGHLAG